MSKQIRLEIPLNHNNKYLPKVWLRVKNGKSLAFADSNCTVEIPIASPKTSVEVNIPEEMQRIEVLRLSDLAPANYISSSWAWLDSHCNLKISRLQKLLIIFDDKVHEVPVTNGKPDRTDWVYYTSVNDEGKMLFQKKWALIVANLKDATVGTLYLSSDLIEE